jgi:glycerol-3-phosphate dehydrogenase
MTGTDYDLIVVGGGINGAGIARDAAGRGARVALVERGDLAQGTSSASTKLIHGGLRYLEHYEFALVREALREREKLWAIAPHIIWPLRFVLPFKPGIRPRWLIRLGLFLYDHIGGRKRLPGAKSLDLRRDPAGAVLLPAYRHGFEYSDGWVDDARLVVLNARDAADHGADVLPRHDVTKLDQGADYWTVSLRTPGGSERQITARAVVNAAGPSVLALLDAAHAPHRFAIRMVRGSHIVVKRLFDHDRAYFCQNDDGRIFFAIPYEQDFTLIGTTDSDHHGPLTDVRASAEEIAYLCDATGDYFRAPITPADVVWSYAGVRPLVEDGSDRPEAATRGYRFDHAGTDAAPLVSVFGGKITTYRTLAEGAMAQLADALPILDGPSWTATRPLPGGDFPMDGAAALTAALITDYPFVTPAHAARLARLYGTTSRVILGDATCTADLGAHFGNDLYAAEVNHLVTREWAQTADDILWRRTKMGLRLSESQVAALAAYLARLNSPGSPS